MSSLRARFEQLSDEDYERAVRELAELAAELAEETDNPIPDEVVEIRNTPPGELRRPEQDSADPTREAASSEQQHDPDRQSQTQGVGTQDSTSEKPKRRRPKAGSPSPALKEQILSFLDSGLFKEAQIRDITICRTGPRMDVTLYAIYPDLVLAPPGVSSDWRIDRQLKFRTGREVSILVVSEKTHKPYESSYKTWAPDHRRSESVSGDSPAAAREIAD